MGDPTGAFAHLAKCRDLVALSRSATLRCCLGAGISIHPERPQNHPQCESHPSLPLWLSHIAPILGVRLFVLRISLDCWPDKWMLLQQSSTRGKTHLNPTQANFDRSWPLGDFEQP